MSEGCGHYFCWLMAFLEFMLFLLLLVFLLIVWWALALGGAWLVLPS